jgi:uncharacterized protein YecT (DUF1311 family)
MRHFILCILLLPAAASAAAMQPYQRFRISDAESDRLVSPDYRRCMDSSGGVTSNMRDCSYAEWQRLDVRLNHAYRAAMVRLASRTARDRLRTLERRWLATRYRRCDRDARHVGGTLGIVTSDACSLDENIRRILWLERYGRR